MKLAALQKKIGNWSGSNEALIQWCKGHVPTIELNFVGLATAETHQLSFQEVSWLWIGDEKHRHFTYTVKKSGTTLSYNGKPHLVVANILTMQYQSSGQTKPDNQRLVLVALDELEK